MTKYTLVGDVSGTDARLVLYDIISGETSQAKTYPGLDYPSLGAVIRVYLEERKVEMKDDRIVIACPIIGDWAVMTNHTWAFSTVKMKKNLGFNHLKTINDSTTVSMAIPIPKKERLTQFGDAEPVEDKPTAVYDAGTGFEVTHLAHVDKHWVSLLGEGDHVDLAPNSEEETIIFEILRVGIGHILAGRVLFGPGLVNLCRVIVKADNRLPENLKPEDTTEHALADSCIDCRRVLLLFCIIMGRFGGNLALNLGTSGGVFIAGGIVPRFLEFFKVPGSCAASEDKGRFKKYIHDIPVHLIVYDNSGLFGSGVYLRQTLDHIL